MASTIAVEIAIILLLVLINGWFSMSELAVLSARKTRLREKAKLGSTSAAAALKLAGDPNRFLPTIQLGITLVGTCAGAFGGATVAYLLNENLERIPALAPYSQAISLSIVVLAITLTTLVLGELVPKRIALNQPERIACFVAKPIALLAKIATPLVHVLGGASEFVVRLLRSKPSNEPPVTEEEIDSLIKQGMEAGVFDPSERNIIRRVFRLGDRTAGNLMTPRSEVVWIDLADPPFEIQRKIAASHHSRFPVCEGSLDNFLGVIQVKDLLAQSFRGQPFNLHGILILPLFLYEGTPGFKVLEIFKSTMVHIGIVLNEHGAVEGVITLNDILEALVGELPEPGSIEEPAAIPRSDGSWLVDGRCPLDQVQDLLDLPHFPRGDYNTLAGFIIEQLGQIPATADQIRWSGWVFEVVDMDAHRIDKVLVSREQMDQAQQETPERLGNHS